MVSPVRTVKNGAYYTMVIYELFHITHDLGITKMSRGGHFRKNIVTVSISGCWLRMKNEWYSKKSLKAVKALLYRSTSLSKTLSETQ